MQPRTFLKLTAVWSLVYPAAWIACAAVVIPICIAWSGMPFKAGLVALWSTPHLVQVLVGVPLVLTFLVWFVQIGKGFQRASAARKAFW